MEFFKKSDLKGDMLLAFSNGTYAFVWHNVEQIGDYLMAPFDLEESKTTRGFLADLDDELTFPFWNEESKDSIRLPCVAIYSSAVPGCLGRYHWGRQMIWNRKRGHLKRGSHLK